MVGRFQLKVRLKLLKISNGIVKSNFVYRPQERIFSNRKIWSSPRGVFVFFQNATRICVNNLTSTMGWNVFSIKFLKYQNNSLQIPSENFGHFQERGSVQNPEPSGACGVLLFCRVNVSKLYRISMNIQFIVNNFFL